MQLLSPAHVWTVPGRADPCEGTLSPLSPQTTAWEVLQGTRTSEGLSDRAVWLRQGELRGQVPPHVPSDPIGTGTSNFRSGCDLGRVHLSPQTTALWTQRLVSAGKRASPEDVDSQQDQLSHRGG